MTNRRTLLSTTLRTQTDIARARRRSRKLAELLRLSLPAQNRLATAIDDLARSAIAHGEVEYAIDVVSSPQGTSVELAMRIDHASGLDEAALDDIASELMALPGEDHPTDERPGGHRPGADEGRAADPDRAALVREGDGTDDRTARFDEYRDRMLSVISHDLRSPLSAILIAVELLRAHDLDASANTTVGRIESCANRTLRMIAMLLDYTNLFLGDGIAVESSEQDVTPVVREVVTQFQSRYPDRELRLDAAESPLPARIDRDRVAEAVGNLLHNAINHGSKSEPVSIAVAPRGNAVAVSVSNGGPPIEPDTLARVFEPFVTGDTRGSNSGFGLGLYIVRAIAEAHGGTAELTSSQDAGTVARLLLPAA